MTATADSVAARRLVRGVEQVARAEAAYQRSVLLDTVWHCSSSSLLLCAYVNRYSFLSAPHDACFYSRDNGNCDDTAPAPVRIKTADKYVRAIRRRPPEIAAANLPIKRYIL